VTDRLRVAVVGVGYLGRFHAQKYAALDDLELVAVCDLDKTRAEAVAAEVGAPAVTDYQDLLGRVDAVSVVVPTEGHFQVARDFLNAGADVLVEKPFTKTLAQADELIDLAARQNRIIQVGHLERFNPVVQDLYGELEDPVFFECTRVARYKARSLDVDVVMDLMIHDIDLILGMVPVDLELIHAVGVPAVSEVPDMANVRLVFSNGCVANVTASRVSLKEERMMRIFQPTAYFRLDLMRRRLTVIRGVSYMAGVVPRVKQERRRHSEGDPLYAEILAFTDCVRHRVEPYVDGRAGRRAMAVALEISEQIDRHLERIDPQKRRAEVKRWVGLADD
jgi:predicted dehydrogenase